VAVGWFLFSFLNEIVFEKMALNAIQFHGGCALRKPGRFHHARRPL
jgi:hypothetical protein